ncbi:MAG TPA: hypothetical protein PK402_12545 [Tepidisphaeraceae bacterium]|nr:hypothetical protein [Tepidisphaeraceae bacterium]
MSSEFGRIDVHSHILPGLDDGSTSIDESLAIARRLVQAGYTHSFCTPHVWPMHTKHRPAFIAEQVELLQRALDEKNVALKLLPGAELNLELDLFSIPTNDIPTYANFGKYALFDFWDSEMPRQFWLWIRVLTDASITPILGHPERIDAIRFEPDIVDEFAREGILLQCNLQSLTGALGRDTKRVAERLLSDGKYFMLGTDAHRLDTLEIRIEGIERAIELVGRDEVDRLMRVNPMKLIPTSRRALSNP